MAVTEFTVDNLRRILREGAGVGDGVDLDGEILDQTFEDLGYESLALLEAGGRIEREYGIVLADGALAEATTPRSLIDLVNTELTAVSH